MREREFMIISASDQREGILITKLLWQGVVYVYSGGNEWMTTPDNQRVYQKDFFSTMKYGIADQLVFIDANMHIKGAESAIIKGAIPVVVSSMGKKYRVKQFKSAKEISNQ